MDIDSIPLFSMLRSRLGYLTQREQLISQNVANTDTPGYAPKDLSPFSFSSQVAGQGGASGGGSSSGMDAPAPEAGHIALKPTAASGAWKPLTSPDSEATLDGNQVVLEDQMMKMNEARMDYDAAIGFYQKSLGLIRLAARRPGG